MDTDTVIEFFEAPEFIAVTDTTYMSNSIIDKSVYNKSNFMKQLYWNESEPPRSCIYLFSAKW